MKRIPFGRLIACLVLAFAIIRFAGVVASGVTAVTYGDFAATLPGPYAEGLNPTLWNSPDLASVQARQTYTYGPTQFLTLYPIVFLDSYAAIARLLLVVYVGLILLTCWVISKSFDFLSEGDAVSRRLLIYGSTLLFFPLLQALIQREFEVVILLALSLMYWAALRDNRRALGGLIAYITWFKYLPLVVGLPYLIARRWWRAVAAFALTSVVMLGLSELLFGMSLFFNNLGPELAREPFTALRSSTAFCADWSPIQTTEVNIRWGLCGLKAQGFWVPLPFSYLALIAVTAFVGYVGLWSFEHRDQISLASERWRRVWEISLVIIVYSTFLAGHYYYLSALILPLLALFIRFTSGAAIQKTRLAIAVLAYALLSAFVLPISVLSA
ncbi:MAG: glycosyltransferase family 87 protein, partial [Candidatus Latescibacteria bacterium]|nr:glycosyltransferase family 87 protein [Candidatus Latescibacterota bacterium]